MKNILRNRNLTLTLLGRFVSNFGTYIQSFVLSLYVLNQTGSATMFASVMAIAFLPRLLIGPFAGVLVDRWNRKKIIVGLDVLSGLIMVVFAFYYLAFGSLPISLIIVVELLMSIINTFFSPAIGTVIPTVVSKENLPEANSAKALGDSIANITSPLLGSLLYGVFGVGTILIINGISFFASALSESFIKLPKWQKKKEALQVKSFFKEFGEGVAFIKQTKDVLAFIVFGFVVNFMLSPLFGVIVPYILKETLTVTDVEYGLLSTLLALGMIIGPLLAPLFIKKAGYKKAVYVGFTISAAVVAVMGGALHTGLMGIYPTKWIPIAILVVLSIAIIAFVMIINIALQTLAQSIIPMEIFGRVGAVAGTTMVIAVPLGQMIFGFMMDAILPWIVLVIAAMGLLISAYVYYAMVKPSKNIDPNEKAGEAL